MDKSDKNKFQEDHSEEQLEITQHNNKEQLRQSAISKEPKSLKHKNNR